MRHTFWIVLATLALAVLLTTGCIKQVGMGPAVPLFNDAKTREVIWVQRDITLFGANGKAKVVHGLFACYRATTPGPPLCYMARHMATRADMIWPGK